MGEVPTITENLNHFVSSTEKWGIFVLGLLHSRNTEGTSVVTTDFGEVAAPRRVDVAAQRHNRKEPSAQL